jgi:hypothetical protein
MDFTLTPKGSFILGKIVDIQESKGGITLATSEIKNVTVMVIVKHVGPDVKNCKIGDIVIYMKMNHIWLRDGTHWAEVDDKDIICTVEGLDHNKLAIEGEKRVDGQPYVPTPRPSPTA